MAAPSAEAPLRPGTARGVGDPPEEPMGPPGAAFSSPPQPLWWSRQEFAHRPHNFLRGCKWAPDGSCVLTCSDDNSLRIFDLPDPRDPPCPELEPALRLPEGDTIYDFTWFPLMDSRKPDTCLVASSSRDNPVHLFDAFDGTLRGSFRAYNHLEEPVAPHSLTFAPDGRWLLGGCAGSLRLFPTQRPGRHCLQQRLSGRGQGQRGLIGCLAFSPSQSLLACGSYGRSLGLYPIGEGGVVSEGGAVALWPHLPAAPTHLRFSPDGTRLYAGGRKDRHILCWDLRSPDSPVMALERLVTTNQRVTFDLDPSGRYLVSGDTQGFVTVWDTLSPPRGGLQGEDLGGFWGGKDPPVLPPLLRVRALSDCINGTSLHPELPLLATASGQRLFPAPWDSDNEEGGTEGPPPGGDNRLQLWWWGQHPPARGDSDWDPGTDTGGCHPSGDAGTEASGCHPAMESDCHPGGDTVTPGGDCSLPRGADGPLCGDSRTGESRCHPLGDTGGRDIECHPLGDTLNGHGDSQTPGDSDSQTPGGCDSRTPGGCDSRTPWEQ